MWFDLHRHLEGSHSPRALLAVARQFAIEDPVFFDGATRTYRSEAELTRRLTMQGPSDDATIFYQCIVAARAAYVSVDAIRALAAAAFREAAADTDGYEMRLSLFSMARTLLDHQRRPWREVAPTEFADAIARPLLLAIAAARDEVQRETGKPARLRLGWSRTFESEPHYRALGAMLADHADALVGQDVLGIVTGPDPEPMPAALADIITQLRVVLPDLTIHAGEFADHDSVDRTLGLAPRAIGHGVRSLQSAATLARLADAGVTLEVCPTSNHLLIPTALRALEAAAGAAPLVALQRAHVHCVLGSDDPTPMGTSYQQELTRARASGVDMDRLAADIARRWAELPAR